MNSWPYKGQGEDRYSTSFQWKKQLKRMHLCFPSFMRYLPLTHVKTSHFRRRENLRHNLDDDVRTSRAGDNGQSGPLSVLNYYSHYMRQWKRRRERGDYLSGLRGDNTKPVTDRPAHKVSKRDRVHTVRAGGKGRK